MAVPPPRSYTGSQTTVQYYADNTPPSTTTVSRSVVLCTSSSSARQHTPFKYRMKAATVEARHVYDRNWKGSQRKAKKLKYQPSAWRDPKPYSASFREGNLTCFNGRVEERTTLPPPRAYSIRSGDLLCSDHSIDCPAFPGFSPGLESRAVVKALSNLKSQDVNLAVAFAERTETAELLIKTLSGLAKAARSLRHGDMRGVARGLGLTGSPKDPKGKTFPQKWLELQYGWLPLYSDVYGATKALHAVDQNDPKRYMTTVKGSATSEDTVRESINRNYGYRAIRTTERKELALCRLDYYLENPLLATLSQLGITNPLLVAWERVPFSFAVDWFLPVGNYLSAMDAALGWKFRAGSLSRVFKQRFNGFITPSSWNPLYFSPCWGEANVRTLDFSRTIYSSSPLPRIPSFKNPFPHGSTHIANAIALFASSLRH